MTRAREGGARDPAGRRSDTLIVIPAYNEEEALPAVLAELAREVGDHDVLVVDDGSRDATAAVARAAGVTVAVLPFNLGIGGALRTGFRYARRHGYERVIQFDADGQHDAREIATILAPLAVGADLVIGSRFADPGSSYSVGRLRGGAMGMLRLIVRVLSGQALSDTSSGFRAFSPRCISLFAETYPRDYMDSVEALLLASNAGLHVAEVPVRMRPRAGGVPSTRRLRLVYHYLRLYVVIVLTVPWRRRLKQG